MTSRGGPRPISGAALVALCLSGCAVVFQKALPARYDGVIEPRCDVTKGWALLDAIVGGVGLAGVLIGLDDAGASTDAKIVMIGGGAGLAVINGLSATRGWDDANACQRARRRWDGEHGGRE